MSPNGELAGKLPFQFGKDDVSLTTFLVSNVLFVLANWFIPALLPECLTNAESIVDSNFSKNEAGRHKHFFNQDDLTVKP